MSDLLKKLTAPGYQYDDEATYELIGSGRTIGCFQIESPLLRTYSKKLKPEKLKQLADLISIVRPGTLEVQDEESGKNMATLYCMRKNGELPTKPLFPCLEPLLRDTYQILVYQEQAMSICREIAGFNLQEADDFRKAAGKKKPELMAPLRSKFVNGAEKVGKCTRDEADKIFDILEKSQRYSFNLSHGVSYAQTCYITAYLKANYTKEFFVSWLRNAKDSADKFTAINELINDAKSFNIEVFGPSLYNKNKDFEYHGDGIYFGLSSIREIGDASIDKIISTISNIEATKGTIKNLSWLEFLTSVDISAGIMKSLILSGALDYMGVDRQKMQFEYNRFNNLTATQLKAFAQILETQKPASLSELIGIYLANPPKINNRKPASNTLSKLQEIKNELDNPPFSLKDSADFISFQEEFYLGVPITKTKLDDRDVSVANCTLQQIQNGYDSEYMVVAVLLEAVREYTIKKQTSNSFGKCMAFITASDKSTRMDNIVAFADIYETYRDILSDGNTVLLRCKRSENKEKGESILVEKVWQI